jgi:hypothetical protein
LRLAGPRYRALDFTRGVETYDKTLATFAIAELKPAR